MRWFFENQTLVFCRGGGLGVRRLLNRDEYPLDRLSVIRTRIPKSRALIDEYLSDEDIEYIIEYSIAPSTFVPYIQAERTAFTTPRNTITWKKRFPYRNYAPALIVKMVEETRDQIAVQDLAQLMLAYSYEEVKDWLDRGDPYYRSASLVLDPAALTRWWTTIIRSPRMCRRI